MGNQWMIDVLDDLKAFAALNDLPGIAAKIEETLTVARSEVLLSAELARVSASGEKGEVRQLYCGSGTSGRA